MDIQSGFMLLAICNEALGLSLEEILNSDYALLLSVLRERNFFMNSRHKDLGKGEDSDDYTEYVEITDFATGKKKKIPKVKSL